MKEAMGTKRYVLRAWQRTRYKGAEDELRCSVPECRRILAVGDEVVTKGSGGATRWRIYCVPCARRLNIIL